LSQEEIEGYLREYLGVSKIIWLKEGIAGTIQTVMWTT